MMNEYEPKEYLSKRENGTYCVISETGMPVNAYTSKKECIRVAEVVGITLPDVVWCAKSGSFIDE